MTPLRYIEQLRVHAIRRKPHTFVECGPPLLKLADLLASHLRRKRPMALLPAREFPPGRLRSSQVRLLKRYVVSLAVLQDLHAHRLNVVFCVAHLKLEKGTETDSF